MEVVKLDPRIHGNLWNNPSNQLRRKIGPFVVIYHGGAFGGTVKDESGKCWDYFLTDEALPGGFKKIAIVEAR
jgi:hypothetical protein